MRGRRVARRHYAVTRGGLDCGGELLAHPLDSNTGSKGCDPRPLISGQILPFSAPGWLVT
jgi:hypothetical protein